MGQRCAEAVAGPTRPPPVEKQCDSLLLLATNTRVQDYNYSPSHLVGISARCTLESSCFCQPHLHHMASDRSILRTAPRSAYRLRGNIAVNHSFPVARLRCLNAALPFRMLVDEGYPLGQRAVVRRKITGCQTSARSLQNRNTSEQCIT
jgi:hypothetical protein